MLNATGRAVSRSTSSSRLIHSSEARCALKQIQKGNEGKVVERADRRTAVRASGSSIQASRVAVASDARDERRPRVKRNEVGVQLLSRKLHEQIFRNVSFPPPERAYVRIARAHLESHKLDIHQGSVLPDIGFTLPPLQGRTLDEHFHRIGMEAAEPWLSLSKEIASHDAPPKPDCWHIQPGWTRYHFRPNGSSFWEPVQAPDEAMLTFDVETMPEYHPYPVLACAMSKDHWYAWVSPWLLDRTQDPRQLIPLGDPNTSRVVVGHNVSYDRARVLEEYSISGTQTRFMDTLSLHVAVKGISSHQRPAWMKYKKSKADEKLRKEEAYEQSFSILEDMKRQEGAETDPGELQKIRQLRQDIEDTLPELLREEGEVDDGEAMAKRWEDITSANSLREVAKLHCGIEVDKEIRNDFMTHTPEEILEGIHDYLDYCASDVVVTHSVFRKVFPEFLASCPSPVSFAGVAKMGSSFLTVNEAWEQYLQNAEQKYEELNEKVKSRLEDLALKAREMAKDAAAAAPWIADPWLSQLDWTQKVVGKSRLPACKKDGVPQWFEDLQQFGPTHAMAKDRILPLLLRARYDGHPLRFSDKEGWTYIDAEGHERRPGDKKIRVWKLSSKSWVKHIQNGRLQFDRVDLMTALCKESDADVTDDIMNIGRSTLEAKDGARHSDPSFSQLNWEDAISRTKDPVAWPKWYWELAKPKKGMSPGTVDITVRNRLAPLLLRLSWRGWPLHHSHEHGWVFRVDPNAEFETRAKSLSFYDDADKELSHQQLSSGYTFYKLPHKDGEEANVGSPLSKTFMKYAQDGTLTSPGGEAQDALEMNAQCSYWISSRDRILKQMVVWQDKKMGLDIPQTQAPGEKWGVILPQMVTMGTVTRRAIEKTWLTASNAKKNRVGSELKAMVRAPEGYAIVGADVDSEELWISSAMGDAQFGIHGATALGWMTLEGTKAAGTDLHSKTASILGISRDQAKVFNYSRIYGAGMRHAVLLLLQANANMLPEDAQKAADILYASTKGKNTHRTDIFGRKLWFGGTESFVFNKLEEIALSDRPQTPALGCGVTLALSKEYLPSGFGTDYMTSRINWVVQSSGVDYLHLLIVSMDHLIKKYDIKARYLISVHDELRYLATEEDKYRAALALQIANLWTRCLFAYKLGMDDLPQGVAFFSAVDVDKYLRKEVDLPCVTPSQPTALPPGESLNIVQVLAKTNEGSLWRDGRPMQEADGAPVVGTLEGYKEPNCLAHRASSPFFLQAQATSEFNELKRLAELDSGLKFEGGIGGQRRRPYQPGPRRKVAHPSTQDVDRIVDRSRGSPLTM